MNFKKLMRGAAMFCASSILWVSCSKENDTISVPTEEVPNSNLRKSGVVPDDPALVAKVPIISSADFMADKISNYFIYQPQHESARGGGRDRITPLVNITNPLSGATVSGSVIVQVTASDNVGVVSVVLKLNGNTLGTINAAPYNFNWNTLGLTSGTHTLTATAVDAAGNSKTHTIQVGYNTPAGADITPPSISITSPVNGASVSSTITVSASASDNVGVSSVNFQVDGAAIATDNTPPYSVSWNSTTVAAGIHTLTAIATDGAGNSNFHSIQVTVNTTIITPPTLPYSVILAMPPVGNQGVEGSCIPFAVAYAARSCEQYYRSNASSYSLSANIFSPEYVFNQIQTGCSGSSLLTALDLIVNRGACTWTTMPYSDNGCSLQPTASQNAEAANYKIASYSLVYTVDRTAMKSLLTNKHPLMMYFANENNFNNAGPGYIWKSKDASNGFGSHAITICGYDDALHAYKAINSWGTSWGSAGYIWIDYDFLPSVASTVYVMN